MANQRVIPQNAFWVFVPALVWAAFFALRPLFFHTWCAVEPTPCTAAMVNAFDQIVFQFHSKFFDFLSNLVQNGCAVSLFLLPVAIVRDWRKLIHIEYFFLLGSLWNGAVLEFGRLLAQRPRPLVMASPMGDGSNINQYTSFYSGHTSYVSFAMLTLFFWIRSEYGPKHRNSRIALVAWIGLTILTACLRVLGGRHYPTDTIAGGACGALLAFFIWKKFSSRYLTTAKE